MASLARHELPGIEFGLNQQWCISSHDLALSSLTDNLPFVE